MRIGFLLFLFIFNLIFPSESSLFDKGIHYYDSRSKGAIGVKAKTANIDSAIKIYKFEG